MDWMWLQVAALLEFFVGASLPSCKRFGPNSRDLVKIVAATLICSLPSGAMAASKGRGPASTENIILKAPFPTPDDHSCALHVNGGDVGCELVLYLGGRGIQFNNDDSGRMVIFEGRGRLPGTTQVTTVTLANVVGQPTKTQAVKVTGQCTALRDRSAECQAKARDGRIFEGTVQISLPKQLTCSGTFVEHPHDAVIDLLKLVRRDAFSLIKGDNSVCYLPWGGAGRSPLNGKCSDGDSCRVDGTYRDHLDKAYVLENWNRAERQPR